MTEEFNPSRLDLARRRRGMTRKALAEAANLSIRILTDYEHGLRSPTEKSLHAIAEALEFPATFFLGNDLAEPREYQASFRSLSTLSARQRDQALSSGAIALALNDWIQDRFELP